jgi:hypothetical protein
VGVDAADDPLRDGGHATFLSSLGGGGTHEPDGRTGQ